MPTELKLPELGENVTAGDVMRVLVKPGDTIAKDQAVLELETDKATIEVPSSVAGVVRDVQVAAGQKIKVGQTILTVDDAGAGAGDAQASGAAKHAEPEKLAAQPSGAPEEGGLSQEVSEPAEAQPAPEPSTGIAPPAAPSVRRIARELGVDIRQVSGTGPAGRITVDDVQGFVRQALATGGGGGGSAPASSSPAQALPDFSKWGDVERKPLSNIRRKTAEHLGHAWNVIPHVTQHDKADITALEELRKKYGPQAERAGGKLTVTVVALRILAGAIRKFPQFAASIDMGRAQLIYKKYAHIGVAVDTDRGLLVPVIRDVDQKGIVDLSAELAKASEKARAGKLSLDDMSGGVMTITNLGGIGGVGFTPIVNWPEVAILGISRGSYEPVWNGSEFQPRLMLPLSLSYDHRVIDGADAARFLRWVADAFEQPFVLAL